LERLCTKYRVPGSRYLTPDGAISYLFVRATLVEKLGFPPQMGLLPWVMRQGGKRAEICNKANNKSYIGSHFSDHEDEYWSAVIPPAQHRPIPAWCGIFATWVWKGAMPGEAVQWKMWKQNETTGIMFPRRTKDLILYGSHIKMMLCPGDIVVHDGVRDGGANHHMIVTDVSLDGSQFWVVEGNAPWVVEGKAPGGYTRDTSVVNKTTSPKQWSGQIDPYFVSVDSVTEGRKY
jgi:hypothetical protein